MHDPICPVKVDTVAAFWNGDAKHLPDQSQRVAGSLLFAVRTILQCP